MEIQSINPSNYQLIGSVRVSTEAEVQAAVTSAHAAFVSWKQVPITERIGALRSVLDELSLRKRECAELQSSEMGMIITESLSDIDGTIKYGTWYCDNAEAALKDKSIFDGKVEHKIVREPLGVVGVIIPWNFPFANMVWGAFQALLAGNVVVLKHSEETPLSGKLIEEIFSNHLPQGVFQEVYGAGSIGEFLARQNINMLSFTGSSVVGKKLFKIAGEGYIKTTMELGGSSPGIILPDADPGLVAESVAWNRLLNQGQRCAGLKRLIIPQELEVSILKKLIPHFSKKIGNALDPEVTFGPLVAKRQLEKLQLQMDDALAKGAVVVCGGRNLEVSHHGAYFEPTVLSNVTSDMDVWREEVFGPILPVVTYDTLDEAVTLANDTQYGLGAYIYGTDPQLYKKIASQLETAMVSFNDASFIQPYLPFGGYKNSGMGRQHGEYGFEEVTQIKVVSL